MAIYSIANVIDQAERKVYGKLLAPESELGKMARDQFQTKTVQCRNLRTIKERDLTGEVG